MTQKFIDKVIRERIYDTGNYRYVAHDEPGALTIKRIALDCLDTTAALSDKSDNNPFGWETVHQA